MQNDMPVSGQARGLNAGRMVIVAVIAVAIGAFSGVAFAAWIENGSAMLMSLSASGLSWCF